MRNARPPRDTGSMQSYQGLPSRDSDSGAAYDLRNGVRWLLGGVLAFFMGVVIGELWPQITSGVRGGTPVRTATVAPAASAPVEVVDVGTHRLAVPVRMLPPGEANAARRARGGFVTYLAWADPENPASEASRRCIDARPRCRDAITLIVTSNNRQTVEQQWAAASRTMQPVDGGEPYGVRLHTAPGADGRANGSLEFAERSPAGGTVYGRCPRARRETQAAPGAREVATIDPSANCSLAFDLRPGLSVTILVRGERLADWRRAQVAAATLVEGFVASGAASRA